jgi:MFS family permease
MIESVTQRAMFRSLRHRNAKLFFGGLLVSNVGTWMQATVQIVVVLKLATHDKGTWLGVVTACQFLPMLLLGAWAGAVADRSNRRRLVFITQGAAAIQALGLAIAGFLGLFSLPLLCGFALVLGVINAMDNPARRSLHAEIVDHDEIVNAMALNTAVMTGSRVVGPALGGLLAGPIGPSWCFFINGASYVAILGALATMDRSLIHPLPRAVRARGQVRAGLRYAASDPTIRIAMIGLVVVSTIAFNFNLTLPLLVNRTFHRGSGTFGAMLAVDSAGSVIGSLIIAARRTATLRTTFIAMAVLGVCMLAIAGAPNLAVAFLLALPLGAGSAAWFSSTTGLLQTYGRPDMRGRLLALQSTAFLGSTPIGSPIMGFIADHTNARWPLAVGGIATVLAAAWTASVLRRPATDPTPATASG